MIKQCLINYGLISWSGYVPKSCRKKIIALPIDYAPYLWGWPRVFMSRMKDHGTEVILTGYTDNKMSGIDDPEFVADLSKNFNGIIWTNKIEKLSAVK